MMLATMSSSLAPDAVAMRNANGARERSRVPDIRELLSYRLALLARINDRIGHAEVAAPFGVTLGEWRVLAVISYLGEASLRTVARQSSLDEGQVSRSVKSLVGRGLIVRREAGRDRRSLRLALSAAGRTLHARMLARAREVNQPASYGLDAAELGALMRLLDRVLGHLNDARCEAADQQEGTW
jgi:DNA-binding MarR family transcriptional regulator